jgi:molybdate transport system ATP-binding protein
VVDAAIHLPLVLPPVVTGHLLLLDEPLGSLDEERKVEILPYLVRLRDEAGVPTVYVSHDAGEMRQLATRIVMLKRGHVIAFGGTEVLPAVVSY